jgi:hypothetical protein
MNTFCMRKEPEFWWGGAGARVLQTECLCPSEIHLWQTNISVMVLEVTPVVGDWNLDERDCGEVLQLLTMCEQQRR